MGRETRWGSLVLGVEKSAVSSCPGSCGLAVCSSELGRRSDLGAAANRFPNGEWVSCCVRLLIGISYSGAMVGDDFISCIFRGGVGVPKRGTQWDKTMFGSIIVRRFSSLLSGVGVIRLSSFL